jgi:tRNA(Ile)-lysidine synthase
MIKGFNLFTNSLLSNNKDSKILLAVSGGIDSMVMLDLFQKSEYEFAVANINFKLRGKEANNEAIFVKEYCNKKRIQLYQKEFDTESYATKNKISIQMAARTLRYEWFDALADDKQFNLIATAHHLDDQSETFFINLIRGTGISGLHGIAKIKDKLIRPLLFTTRAEITEYAAKHNVPYKEDSSNASDKYQRNFIRHHILPEFYKLRSDFSLNLDKTIGHLSELENYAQMHIETEIENMIENSNLGIFQIKIQSIINNKFINLILYTLLKEYGFQNNHINNIVKLIINKNSGKVITSSNYKLFIDRNSIILAKKEVAELLNTDISINSIDDNNWAKVLITTSLDYKGKYRVNDSNLAFIDFELINFPLTVRKWKQGDSFKPLGMKGSKKLSDFFIDNKLSIIEKENVKLLCSGDKIIWVIGHRIDNRFSITKNTKRILKLEYYGNN